MVINIINIPKKDPSTGICKELMTKSIKSMLVSVGEISLLDSLVGFLDSGLVRTSDRNALRSNNQGHCPRQK